MKKSKIALYAVLAVGIFAMGAGVSLLKNRPAPQVAEAPVAEAPAPVTADAAIPSPITQAMPTAEPGQIIPDAPAMPNAEPAAGDPHAHHAEAAPAPAEAPVAGVQAGGPFSLTDHKGNKVTESSWPGKYKLVFFGFTRCPDICPAGLQKITAVMDAFDPKAEKIQPLFITTDPANDTPEVMATYVGGYHASLVGLTGTKEEIAAAEKAYKVYAAETPGGGMDHSSFIYLMSPDDRLLAILSSKDAAEEMVAKIREKAGQ